MGGSKYSKMYNVKPQAEPYCEAGAAGRGKLPSTEAEVRVGACAEPSNVFAAYAPDAPPPMWSRHQLTIFFFFDLFIFSHFLNSTVQQLQTNDNNKQKKNKHILNNSKESTSETTDKLVMETKAETKSPVNESVAAFKARERVAGQVAGLQTSQVAGTKTSQVTSSKTSQATSSKTSQATSSKTSQVTGFKTSQDVRLVQKQPHHRLTTDSEYRPIVPPTRRAEDFLKVVRPRGNMAAKHAASAPYHIFYTTITDAGETHSQPYSITLLEILDSSLGELKCSLQMSFLVEIDWLLEYYYFAGYSEKKLTILHGDETEELRTISEKKPNVDAHKVSMPSDFGTHHTKMMVLCYEDGSLRVVVSTANLYSVEWDNWTQGLWFSPSCPELPAEALPHEGESPTMFKRSLLRYLSLYGMPQISYYVERVKRCDFSHINVFLVASVPGSHFGIDWGMTRVATLLRQHCCIPPEETSQWPLIAQASSIGTYGMEANLWLTGEFLNSFTKIKNQSKLQSSPPELKLIYPSLENVRDSHTGQQGSKCLSYSRETHLKQPWLNNYLYQWKATSTSRNKAMPHIKSYTRVSNDYKMAAYYLLTSSNASKAAWGSRYKKYGARNKGDGSLSIMSYEAGVLMLPRFVINEDFFPLEQDKKNRLVLAYDLPPTEYTSEMTPWLCEYMNE